MGEGAGAAAGHHDTDRVTGQQSGQPVEIGMDVEADMVVMAVKAAGQ